MQAARSQGRSWCPTLSRTANQLAHPLPTLLDRSLRAQLGGLVVGGLAHHVGGVLLLGDAERLVVGVAVLGGVPELLGAAVVAVAQVRRHRTDLAGPDVGGGRRD